MAPTIKATARPRKSFFVRTITRDIALEDCIFDLIDNSIDGAMSELGSPPLTLESDVDLSTYHVNIHLSDEIFSIHDNCGGLSLDDAANYAFSFGRTDDAPQEDFSIGVYGIGMKRAAFKIGNIIRITSTFREKSGDISSFCVPINVKEWLSHDNEVWDFDIDEADDLDEPGVLIEIGELNDGALEAFGNPAFVRELKRAISRDYTFHLARGFRIYVNGEEVSGWNIELAEGDNFKPIRIDYNEGVGEKDVRIEIIAGMAAPPPDDVHPSEDSSRSHQRYGWYVVCNGRVVVAGDKTSLTGWGSDGWPQWHYQYAGFIGIIFFTSSEAGLLPLTTTKRNVDVSTDIYRRALKRTREITKSWINYTNLRKQDIDGARKRESETKSVGLNKIGASDEVILPKLESKKIEKRANVNYSVKLSDLKELAAAYGNRNMTFRDVGLRSFMEAFENNVGESE